MCEIKKPEDIANELISYWVDGGIKEDLEKGLIQKEEDIRARINHELFKKNYKNYRIYNEVLISNRETQKSKNWKLVDTVIFKDEKDKKGEIISYYPSILIEYKCWNTELGDLDKFNNTITNYENNKKTDILLFFAIWDDRTGNACEELKEKLTELKDEINNQDYKLWKYSVCNNEENVSVGFINEDINANETFKKFFDIYHKHYYKNDNNDNNYKNINWIFKPNSKEKIKNRKITMVHVAFKKK